MNRGREYTLLQKRGLLAVSYYVAGWLGLQIPYVGSHITLLWLPTGIAVAALLRWGHALWPGVYFGAFLVNLTIGSSIPLALGIAIGNTLGPLLSAMLLERWHFHLAFDRQKDIFQFVLAALSGMLLSSTGGVIALYVAGLLPMSGMAEAWLAWWMGDAVGVLLAAPLALTMTHATVGQFLRRRGEFLIWLAVAAAVAWAVFLHDYSAGQRLPLAFLTLPLMAWAALRFGITGSSLAVLFISTAAALGIATGHGAFVFPGMHASLFMLWAFMATTVATGLFITALQAERWRAEAMIRENEERLRFMTGNVKDYAFIMLDRGGRVATWNEGAARMFGYEEEDIVGLPWSRLCAAEECEGGESAHLPTLATKGAYGEAESWLVRQDGTRFFADVVISAMHDSDETLTGFACITHDISENRRQIEERETLLRELNTILDNSSVGICYVRDRTLVWVNPAMEKLYGYPASELLGRTTAILYPSREAFEAFGQEAYPALARGESFGKEVEMVRRDGTHLWVRATGKAISPDDLSGRIWVLEDVSVHKEAERAIRESEIKFHTMVDWTNDWEYWIKPDGGFHYMTPSAERITGYRVEEFERNPGLIEAIIHPADRPLWKQHVDEYHAKGAAVHLVEMDIRIVQKEGETRWVSHSCRPVLTDDGACLGRRVAMRDITDRKRAEDEVRQLAYFDPLTGLPNRRLLRDRLERALVASQRSQRFGTLMILDLDHFKKLNDTQGHDAGDRLLVEVAHRLTTTVRREDTVARLGGDEFVVMVEGLDTAEQAAASDAGLVANKIRQALCLPYVLGGKQGDFRTTSSIGLTLFRGLETSMDGLMKQADVALYQAKDAGRNASRFFNPEMQRAIDTRIGLERALREGLTLGEFRLHYQPQVDEDERRIGAEALIRWLNPARGLVSPADFISLAEETGLITDIGQWVLDMACVQIKRWDDDPRTRALQLAVNVSARQFHQRDFVDRVRRSLDASGASPSRLKLELTESVVLGNIEGVIARMGTLHELGVSFSLDDFGTGYSSLSYLKSLPLDQLKIDQSFVRDLAYDSNDASIIKAILAMSRSLGIQAIAEGVETEAQRDFLVRNGCVAYQGYLFGRPVPIEEWVM